MTTTLFPTLFFTYFSAFFLSWADRITVDENDKPLNKAFTRIGRLIVRMLGCFNFGFAVFAAIGALA